MLADRLSEGSALLRIANSFLKCGARNAQAASRHVQALGLQAGHHLLESFAFRSPDQVLHRHGKILEMEFARLHALVTKLVDIAAHGHPRRSLLDDEGAP